MNGPDKAAAFSSARAGELADEPAAIIAVILTDEDNEPAGVLEKWSGDAWIYADADALRETN